MTEKACRLDCKPFRGWTTQHFHGEGQPWCVVFQTPEKRVGNITFHEAWGVDFRGETTPCASLSEAVQLCKRRYGVNVVLGAD